jgi:hypothetical protein
MRQKSQHDDPVTAMVERSQRREGVARGLSESALAGGIMGFAFAAAAFLAARFARIRKRGRS